MNKGKFNDRIAKIRGVEIVHTTKVNNDNVRINKFKTAAARSRQRQW